MARKLTWQEHVEAVQAGRSGLPVVEIVWEDALASATDSWEDEPGTELMLTTSVGYLADENKRSLTIVSLVNGNHVGHALTIPRSCIITRSYLTRGT